MFHNIPKRVLGRMRQLEALDAEDRSNHTDRMKRLRQVPPETGKFLAFLASTAPAGNLVEIGTSAGYSTLWLTLAAVQTNRKIITYEFLQEKVDLASKTFATAGVENVVEQVVGDALDYLGEMKNIAFCFIDAEKDIYLDVYELVIPNLVSGGILVADNIISHKQDLRTFLERVQQDSRVDSVVIPIGKGELLCRKI